MADETESSQVEESGMGGPGAPTPLSALEVSIYVFGFDALLTHTHRVLQA